MARERPCLEPVRLRPRHLATLGLLGLAPTVVVSCRATKECLFSGGTCGGGDDQSLSPAPASAPTFGPTDPTLDSGCDDRIRQSVTAGALDGGDGDAAAPGARCSASSDCAPVSCSCVDGGAAPVEDDAGDAATDGGGEGGDLDAEAPSRLVGVRACFCSTRACATPTEACAVATRFECASRRRRHDDSRGLSRSAPASSPMPTLAHRTARLRRFGKKYRFVGCTGRCDRRRRG